ncbi:helix-turn-helix domain-containing protein [Vacuolonema iberomarrocanum]|uniref:helix-turn-helix domain-containing protein n=1 Tax=Vacuolonema iberomarrocanum TaxID=3454632 RepID=UPI0019D9B2DF|nr:helix-turn-helix transcriptional regulator [filamentous cyanobacterium LEGE 07170]
MTKPTYASLSEYYRDSDYEQFPQEHRTGGSIPVHLVEATQTAHDFIDPAVPELALIITLKADMPFRWDLGNGMTREQRCRTGAISLCPANTEIRYDCGGDHQLLVLGFPADEIESLLDKEAGLTLDIFNPLHQQTIFRDETIRGAALRMWAESRRNDLTSSLMIDGLFQTLLAQLLRRANAVAPTQAERLSPAILARLDDYIEAHCDQGLTVAELAQIAGCPQFYFARSFKATTGQSPYQYVLERRLARACELLAISALSLAEVAAACGFYDQAHLTRIFKKQLGTTPGAYRREVQH